MSTRTVARLYDTRDHAHQAVTALESAGFAHADGRLARLKPWAVLSIAVVDAASAEPGTEVTVLWGEQPRSTKVQVEEHRQVAVRATVQPAPLVTKARTEYRSNATTSA